MNWHDLIISISFEWIAYPLLISGYLVIGYKLARQMGEKSDREAVAWAKIPDVEAIKTQQAKVGVHALTFLFFWPLVFGWWIVYEVGKAILVKIGSHFWREK